MESLLPGSVGAAYVRDATITAVKPQCRAHNVKHKVVVQASVAEGDSSVLMSVLHQCQST
jgi:predicted TIM-barrel fold metal-dependent hydrolase